MTTELQLKIHPIFTITRQNWYISTNPLGRYDQKYRILGVIILSLNFSNRIIRNLIWSIELTPTNRSMTENYRYEIAHRIRVAEN